MSVLSPIARSFGIDLTLRPDSLPEFDDHEGIFFIQDKETGLRGFTAIHNTHRGPAVGGTRYWHYDSDEDALRDALRLSRAMSYKCALANVAYGGGKTVLMAPKNGKKTEKYLRAYAKRINLLNGTFFTGEDVGITPEDILMLGKHSHFIIGRPDVGELPAYWAALSVFISMKTALKSAAGSSELSGKIIAIKGLGNVGLDLAKMAVAEGAKVVGADISHTRIALARNEVPGIEIVDVTTIHTIAADVYAPCALGGDLNERTIRELKMKIVCGAANNQLSSEQDASLLFERGILYIPDYVANAGGLINVVDELHEKGYDRSRVETNVRTIGETVRQLIEESWHRNIPTEDVASEIARTRIEV